MALQVAEYSSVVGIGCASDLSTEIPGSLVSVLFLCVTALTPKTKRNERKGTLPREGTETVRELRARDPVLVKLPHKSDKGFFCD